MADFIDDAELLAELDATPVSAKAKGRSALEERIIAGFEDILTFYKQNGRAPHHSEAGDIFERIYAVRLDRLRSSLDCRKLLVSIDTMGLLGEELHDEQLEDVDDAALLDDLGVPESAEDISVLRNVESNEERRAAEEIASRERCADFDKFKPLLKQVQTELEMGIRKSRPFELKSEIRPGSFFIVSGQLAYVADMEQMFTNAQGRTDARLRVVFDNGTESNMLMRSLQRALHKDEAGRRVTDPDAGPLFSNNTDEAEVESGTIYVLRSKSDHPFISEHRQLIHKIGVTGGAVEARVATAKDDPTFLFADVEIVSTYKLFNMNRAKFESIIHRVFAATRIDLQIKDRFDRPVRPQEWFLVPLNVIDDVITRIQDQSIVDYIYDVKSARLQTSK